MAEMTASQKVEAIHGVLDDVAATKRTTAVLETDQGTLAAGGARDLTPAQRETARAVGATPVRSPGEHAEITVLKHAAETGATPKVLESSRAFCSDCRTYIQIAGGILETAFRAVWH